MLPIRNNVFEQDINNQTFSDDALYIEYSQDGAANVFCLHFTFRSIARAVIFFDMSKECGLPVEIVENQVIILSFRNNSGSGILFCNENSIQFHFGTSKVKNRMNLIEFINKNHANQGVNYCNKLDDAIIMRDSGKINPGLFQIKFSLSKRINKIEEFLRYSVFVLFALNNLTEPDINIPMDVIRIITSLVNALPISKFDEEFPLPYKNIEKYYKKNKTECFLESGWYGMLHLIFSDNVETTQFFNAITKSTRTLKIKMDHNEILIDHASMPSDVTRSMNLAQEKLFLHDSINFYTRTKENPKQKIIWNNKDSDICIPVENLRQRSEIEIVIFFELIHPIFDFIEKEMIARLKDNTAIYFTSVKNNFCDFFVNRKENINMDEKIRNMKISCFKNLKIQISEGLRVRIPLEEIIDKWLKSEILETCGMTIDNVIHLDRENNICERTGSSDCIDELLKEFNEKCKEVLAMTPCTDKVICQYYSGFRL